MNAVAERSRTAAGKAAAAPSAPTGLDTKDVPGYGDKDMESALTTITMQATALRDFLWESKTKAENNRDLQAASDFLIAHAIVCFIGTIADETTGSRVIGGALDWADGGLV